MEVGKLERNKEEREVEQGIEKERGRKCSRRGLRKDHWGRVMKGERD